MKKSLRNYARGKQCYARLTGCSFNNDETVLAHLRIGGVAGTGLKPPDICALPTCGHCHNLIDGRTHNGMTQQEIRAEVLRGLVQWLSDLATEEVIVIVL